ncbi:DUF2913 family protein [Erwinia sp. V71]|uniref:DUF2913 family protein n=1 Tax=Erwinia sp. V71 TaxID=3369424 RepID=UPI003F5FCBD4
MDKGNSSVSHLAWCGLTALHLARIDGQSGSPAQDNLFLTRWLATAEKQRRFPKALASDISWLLKEGRKKGMRADLPGKLEWLWKAGSGDPQAQNDLFHLQQALHAVTLAGWGYGVLSDSEWSGRRQRRPEPSVAAVYLSRSALDGGFDKHGRQRISLPARIGGNLAALDSLLSGTGWRREPAAGEDPMLHHLLAEGFCEV